MVCLIRQTIRAYATIKIKIVYYSKLAVELFKHCQTRTTRPCAWRPSHQRANHRAKYAKIFIVMKICKFMIESKFRRIIMASEANAEPAFVKPERRACARGWKFGQNTSLTHVCSVPSGVRARAVRAKCSLAGLTAKPNHWTNHI